MNKPRFWRANQNAQLIEGLGTSGRRGLPACPESGLESCVRGRALVLLLLQGRPIAYQIFSPWQPGRSEVVAIYCLHLLPLVPLQEFREILTQIWLAGGTWAGLDRLALDTKFNSLEVFLCKNALENTSGVGKCAIREEMMLGLHEAFPFEDGGPSVHSLSLTLRQSL